MSSAARPVRIDAWAKINLYLHVIGRREDRYHLLDSLMAFAHVGDTIEVAPADRLMLSVDGPFAADVPAGDDNLVLRAAQTLAQAAANGEGGAETGAVIRLTKRLPAASGIGGGSADAAAALQALSRLWQLDVDATDLARLGLGLGADVPICLAGRTSFVGGIGEEIDPAPALPPAWMVLANAGVPVPTPAVFKARSGPFSPMARFTVPPGDAAALADVLAARRNDLSEAAVAVAPVIAEVREALVTLRGCLLARMSGSGGTCFALFADEASSEAGAATLRRAYPGWWVVAAPLRG